MAVAFLPSKKSRLKKRNKAASTATMFHGSTGMFGDGALERDIISSVPRPISGLASVLPIVPGNEEITRYGTILGFAVSGSEAATPCDDGPKGTFSGAKLQNSFGMKIASSQVMDARKSIRRTDRTDEALQLVGQILNMDPFSPDLSEADFLNVVRVSEMIGLGIQFEDHLIDVVWQGDPTNDNVGGGYKEAKGFDLLIATGILDINGNPQPALDSFVKNWGFSAPDEPGAGDYAGQTLFEAMSDMEFNLNKRRRKRKARDLVTKIFMKMETWQWVSEALPCQIQSASCQNGTDTNKVLFINANDNLMRTEEMRELGQVKLNGRTYDVVEDDGLPLFDNTSNPSELSGDEESSHIAFVPMTMAGRNVAYLKHHDYRATAGELATPQLVRQWTDDGKYFWVLKEDGYCTTITGTMEVSPVLRTPQFAGKLMNVRHA